MGGLFEHAKRIAGSLAFELEAYGLFFRPRLVGSFGSTLVGDLP